MASKPEPEPELWKLVNRLTGKVYYDNLSHEKGSELLLSNKKYQDKLRNFKQMENKVLVPVHYKFTSHSTMGKIWA